MSCGQIKPQEQDKALDNKKLLELRKIRGYSILAKGDTPLIIDEENFLVPSQSSDRKYKVRHTQMWECECQDFQKRKLECKHIQAIKFFLKLRNSQDESVLKLTQENKNEVCPNCESIKISKQGFRKTATEKKQKYRCLDCLKYFVLEYLS